ncbi:MAG: FMN-binding protein [Eubacteriales bacterium]
MKKILIIIVIVLVIVAVGGFFAIKSKAIDPDDIKIDNVDISSVADGVYTGEYNTAMVSAEVEVAISDGKISALQILRHDCGLGGKAEVIVDDIVSSQSLDVDTVAGATTSSKVILKAVENALTGE